MTIYLPEAPEVPESHKARVPLGLRYEDVSQDGRIFFDAIATGMGHSVWGTALARHVDAAVMASHGFVPILSRFVIEGYDGPFGVGLPIEALGRFALAHAKDARGDVERIYLNMWGQLEGPIGRSFVLPQPPNAGEHAVGGRVFGEHVFTRLFAAPEDRKVKKLAISGMPEVPEARYEARSIDDVLALPEGAEPIDEAFVTDAPFVFGLRHTDSNQHVNSLVYPRLFEEAALRRFVAKGLPATVLARALEISYRKPCFAGQAVQARVKTYKLGDKLGATGTFVPAGSEEEKPYCAVHMVFER